MSAADETTRRSLLALWELAQRDCGGSRVALRLLCGLYNGQRFPFDLTDLRALDQRYLAAALTAITADASGPVREVHELLNDLLGVRTVGPQLEILAYEWRFKGRCTKEGYDQCREHLKRAAGAAAAASSTSEVAP